MFRFTGKPSSGSHNQYTLTQCTIHTPHRSQYAAITLTTPWTASTYLLLTKFVIFSYVLIVAPWWWFPCKPKHAGGVLLILKCFNNSTFFNVVCNSWILKCWILLMHGVTVKFIDMFIVAIHKSFGCYILFKNISYQSQVPLTLRLLMSYIYGVPSKARIANVVYICTYVWQRWNSLFLFATQCFNTESMQRGFLCHIFV